MLITSNVKINIFLLILLLMILHDSLLSDCYLIYTEIFTLSVNIAAQLFIKMNKSLVFVLIAILAVNVIIVTSESECSPWLGRVSTIENISTY
jgi:hypothetical protein